MPGVAAENFSSGQARLDVENVSGRPLKQDAACREVTQHQVA
jgi:hypothetical protein